MFLIIAWWNYIKQHIDVPSNCLVKWHCLLVCVCIMNSLFIDLQTTRSSSGQPAVSFITSGLQFGLLHRIMMHKTSNSIKGLCRMFCIQSNYIYLIFCMLLCSKLQSSMSNIRQIWHIKFATVYIIYIIGGSGPLVRCAAGLFQGPRVYVRGCWVVDYGVWGVIT